MRMVQTTVLQNCNDQCLGQSWRLTSLGLGMSLLVAGVAQAADVQVVADTSSEAMAQVTSVSQLSDVKPTDWAFQSLQSLVERYGCIAGYPDRTYRGNRAMTRYEFAAGLNACMDRVNELIAASTTDLVKKQDLDTLQKLQEEFAAELATLRGRVDALEAKTATLEKQQFSTTTKLNGEVVFGVAGVATGQGPGRVATSKNTVFGYRARLNLDTSFTGEDLLRTRIQAGTMPQFSGNATFTPEGDLRFAADSASQATIDALLYQFPLGKRTTITLEANAGAIDDFTDTLNPFLDGDGSTGALTDFGTRNPIYYLLGGTGLGIKHEFSDKLALSLGYLASNAADPSNKNGLFNGSYGAIAQLTFKPSQQVALGLTYINAYKTDFRTAGSTGSLLANLFSTSQLLTDSMTGNSLFPEGTPTINNAVGGGVTVQISPKFLVNGSVGYTNTRVAGVSGSANIWNWSVGLAFPDLGKEGNLAGLIVGMEPKVTSSSGGLRTLLSSLDPLGTGTPLYDQGRNRDTGLHIEGFYQHQINDRISITPGLIWLTAPDHDSRNRDILIGTLRTTFTF